MKATAIRVVIVASAVLFFGLCLGGFVKSEELPPPPEGEAKAAEKIAAEVEQEKALKEQERKIEAAKHFNAANDALRGGDYQAAIEELTAAAAADPANEDYKETLKRAKVMQINEKLSEKKFAEVKDLCDQFLTDYPGDEQVTRFREQAIAGLQKPPTAEVKAEEKLPAPPKKVQPTAEQLVAEAQDLIRKKDYKMALEKLLQARKLSPYDISIDKKIKRLNEELTRYERAYSQALREEMITGIYEAWARRPRRAVMPEAVEVGKPIEMPSQPRREMLRKLDMIIPEVKFEDAKLTEVVDFLSREADVNIVIDPVVFHGGYSRPATGLETVPGGAAPTPTAPTTMPGGMPGPAGTTIPGAGGVMGPGTTAPGVTAPGAAPGTGEAGGTMGAYIPPLTDTGIKLNLKNVPLKEVLKYVLKWKNLTYVVEDYAILIAPIDYVPPESLVTEIFRLATTATGIIERPELSTTGGRRGAGGGGAGGPSLLGGPTQVGGGGGGAGGQEPGALGGEAAPPPETIRSFLLQSGVSWPPGSGIISNRRTGVLVVTNTPTNMVLIRELVRLWDQPALQVDIEARFVEILHTRWFENSFEAEMLSPLIFSKKATGGPIPSTARRRYQVEAHPSVGTRFLPQLMPSGFPTPDSDTILSIRGIMTEPDFQFIWHAIDQKDWSDLLSAPRVTTISGQQAQIEVVEELTYPTEYNTETINIGGWGGTTNLISGEIFMVTPGNWEKRDVGIILNVTPSVSADGKMITLVLMPEVTDLVSWINYGNEIYPINQPVFETRNVTTTVYVSDGETIVLGGLMTDKTSTYEDKVPLLGSIPFIGRFFRSAVETTSKRNLVIFVTARLITSRGTEAAVERALAEDQARQLGEKIRERKGEVSEIAPGAGTTGIVE